MCRTKIQRTQGCNHMTCLFCRYEFCYYCGDEASSGAGHWDPGMGCGASMTGNSEFLRRGKCCQILLKVLRFIGYIIAYPILVVLGPAIFFTSCLLIASFKEGCCCGLISLLGVPFTIAFGLILDICWTPASLIGIPVYYIMANLRKFYSKSINKRKAMDRIQEIVENNHRLVQNQ